MQNSERARLKPKAEEPKEEPKAEEPTKKVRPRQKKTKVEEPKEEPNTAEEPKENDENEEPEKVKKPRKPSLWMTVLQKHGYMLKGKAAFKLCPKKGTPEYVKLRAEFDEEKAKLSK